MKRRESIKVVKRQKGSGYKYDRAFKRRVALQYIKSDMTLTQVGQMFNVSHQNVSDWAHEFSNELSDELIIAPMTEQEQKNMEALQKQVAALKKKLEYEQMRNFALETMADLVKTELGIEKKDIKRGMVICAPKSITPHTDFKGEVYVLSKEEGGRHTPFFNKYRPQFYFRTTDVTGECELPAGVEMVMPGDNVNLTVKLIAPIAMEKGLKFAIREGGRTVGAGQVTEIIK